MILTKFEMNNINKKIIQEDAKIYLRFGGYSSKLWDRLIKEGWRHTAHKGNIIMTDSTGKVAVSVYGWINALKLLDMIDLC